MGKNVQIKTISYKNKTWIRLDDLINFLNESKGDDNGVYDLVMDCIIDRFKNINN